MQSSSTIFIFTHTMKSPVGPLHLAVDKNGTVISVSYTVLNNLPPNIIVEQNRYACGALAFQLDKYFTGTLRQFDVDLLVQGTDFQIDVWNRLQKITYGKTLTYSEVAQKTGRRHAAQAVGRAVNMNPLRIIIPCHRVLPRGSGIGSYGNLESTEGRRIKEYLLDLEQSIHTAHSTSQKIGGAE